MALKFRFRCVCFDWILALAAVAATPQTQQFPATGTGATASDVIWSVDTIENGNSTVGTISSGGLYTPPAAAGMHTVRASSIANSMDSGSASVAVTNLPGVFTYHNDLSP